MHTNLCHTISYGTMCCELYSPSSLCRLRDLCTAAQLSFDLFKWLLFMGPVQHYVSISLFCIFNSPFFVYVFFPLSIFFVVTFFFVFLFSFFSSFFCFGGVSRHLYVKLLFICLTLFCCVYIYVYVNMCIQT